MYIYNVYTSIYIHIYMYIYVCMYTPPKMLGFIEYIHTKCSRDHYHYVTVLIFPIFPIGWYLHRSLMSRVPMLPSHKTERCIFVGVVLPGAALGTLKGSRTNVKTGNMIPWWRAIMLHGVYIYTFLFTQTLLLTQLSFFPWAKITWWLEMISGNPCLPTPDAYIYK